MYNFQNMLGYLNNAYIFEKSFNTSSNIYVTDNPNFTKEKFDSVFPQFKNNITDPIFNMFYTVADAAIKESRFHRSWEFIMCLYIAHLCTLYLQSSGDENDTTSQVLAQALPKGIATTKSVDGLSISYDFVDSASDMKGYGTFKYTIYGQQLITYCKLYGHAGMWVNW